MKIVHIILLFVSIPLSLLFLQGCGQDGPLCYAPAPNEPPCPTSCSTDAIQTSSTFFPDAIPSYLPKQKRQEVPAENCNEPLPLPSNPD